MIKKPPNQLTLFFTDDYRSPVTSHISTRTKQGKRRPNTLAKCRFRGNIKRLTFVKGNGKTIGKC
jgi:hypothetical protein